MHPHERQRDGERKSAIEREKETQIMMRLDGRSEEPNANNSNYALLQFELQKPLAFMRTDKVLWHLQSTL